MLRFGRLALGRPHLAVLRCVRLCSSSVVPHGSMTAAIHADALDADPLGWMHSTDRDVSPPLSLSTTFTCAAPGTHGHVYSRISNPTRERCESLLAAVEGTPHSTAHAVLYASGLAATFGILSQLLPRRVAIKGGYHGTHLVVAQLQRLSLGARFATIPLPAASDAAAVLQPGDVVWLETPRNPDCVVADVEAYVEAARAIGSVHVIVDGTFAPPPLQRPLTLGADVVMHSTTKYLAGHSDAIGGALCVADCELATRLREDRTAAGSTPGALEVWLLMRSLRTLHLRVQRQSETATALAAWLESAVDADPSSHALAGLVASVWHPSLASSASHTIACRQMVGGFGGCFALELICSEAAQALPAELKLWRDATSLGGVESLIEWRRKYDDSISPRLLRCSVGLEEAEHLKNDLERAILAVSNDKPR